MSLSRVSVVGAGPRGCGIALACAAEGLPVTLVRGARGEVERVRACLTHRLALCAERGELLRERCADILARIVLDTDLCSVADSDLVVDATHRDLRARRAMLATLESRLSSGAVLATTVAVEELPTIAEVVRRPDQLVAIRFEVDATRQVRVEIAFMPETAPGAVAACRAFVAMLHKTPLVRPSKPPPIGYREWLSSPATVLD